MGECSAQRATGTVVEMARPVLRVESAGFDGTGGAPSHTTGYWRRHCGQMYRPCIGHIGRLCLALHHNCPIQLIIRDFASANRTRVDPRHGQHGYSAMEVPELA